MFGRGILGLLALIVMVGVLAGIGVGAYNAGVSQGLADAAIAAQAAGDTPAVVYPQYIGHYGYGYGGWGFGFFGIFFWILGFFLILGLLRAAFGWGRWGGGGPGRGGWNRDERIAELHREMHRRDEQAPGSTG
jgi:hypothetical protein